MFELKNSQFFQFEFGAMDPEEVLYEFDGGALIFTFLVSSRLFFAYVADEDAKVGLIRYLVVPTNQAEIASLKNGDLSILQVLDKTLIWAVDRDWDDKLVSSNCLIDGLAAIPDKNKPNATALLSGSLRTKHRMAEGEVLKKSLESRTLFEARHSSLRERLLEATKAIAEAVVFGKYAEHQAKAISASITAISSATMVSKQNVREVALRLAEPEARYVFSGTSPSAVEEKIVEGLHHYSASWDRQSVNYLN